jgi:hypothetical protein
MFGLTKREQRWKAEQALVETLLTFAGTSLSAAAKVKVAESVVDSAELAKLRDEVGRLRTVEVAARNLINAKSRFHTEQNFKALAALLV